MGERASSKNDSPKGIKVNKTPQECGNISSERVMGQNPAGMSINRKKIQARLSFAQRQLKASGRRWGPFYKNAQRSYCNTSYMLALVRGTAASLVYAQHVKGEIVSYSIFVTQVCWRLAMQSPPPSSSSTMSKHNSSERAQPRITNLNWPS